MQNVELVSNKFTSDISCSFSGCGLTSEGAACLGKMLEKNRHLTSLRYEDRLLFYQMNYQMTCYALLKCFIWKDWWWRCDSSCLCTGREQDTDWIGVSIQHKLMHILYRNVNNNYLCKCIFIIIVLVMWGWHLLVCGDYPFICHTIKGSKN